MSSLVPHSPRILLHAHHCRLKVWIGDFLMVSCPRVSGDGLVVLFRYKKQDPPLETLGRIRLDIQGISSQSGRTGYTLAESNHTGAGVYVNATARGKGSPYGLTTTHFDSPLPAQVAVTAWPSHVRHFQQIDVSGGCGTAKSSWLS